jgi:hypothetical protein
MDKEEKTTECCYKKMIFKNHHHRGGGDSNVIYCLGVVGALFYFLKNAVTFGAILLGIGKAFVWPALLMFKLLTYLQM